MGKIQAKILMLNGEKGDRGDNGTSGVWGEISGDIEDQTDLNELIDNKYTEIGDAISQSIVMTHYTKSEFDSMIDAISQEIGLNAKVLWVNPDPTTALASDTTVTLADLFTNYDYLEIVCAYSTSLESYEKVKIPCGVAWRQSSYLHASFYDRTSSMIKCAGRKVTHAKNSTTAMQSLTFGGGFYYSTTGSSTPSSSSNNSYCIPIVCIGYKY